MAPRLNGLPVVVLSSNDACAVARSNEAKDLGIAMGAPWFKIQHLVEEAGLVGLSSNFALYGDISDRFMSLAAGLGPAFEQYSIDEGFASLTGLRGDLTERSHKIRARILQWVGIPCGIGIGASKTLSKLANHIAKTAERKPGPYPAKHAQVCNLEAISQCEHDALLAATEVGDVWGVGRQIGKQLTAAGIHNALELSRLDPATVRAKWSVVLERTVRELQGTPCLDLETMPPPKREIACTRSFGHAVTEVHQLAEAITEFATKAAFKARKQNSTASQVLVFIRTSPFRRDPQYSKSCCIPLRRPSSDTAVIVAACIAGLMQIFRPGYLYAKAGVMLLDLQSNSQHQFELDLESEDAPNRASLMSTVDALNRRFGPGTVGIASAGVDGDQRAWLVKHERRTPAYTTSWADMPIARA